MTVMLLTVAIAVAGGLGVVVWRQRQEAQQRSAARVAALTAAIDGAGAGTLDAFAAEGAPGLGSWQAAPAPSHRWWLVAGAIPVVLAVAALLITRGPRHVSATAATRQPDSLELLDMRPARAGDMLTVTGTVRVRGRDTAPVTAIVTGRDDAGRVVASAHAPLDDAALDVGGESSFQVSVGSGHEVRRYQVRFETPLGPLAHIDRRAGHPPAPATP